jgi:hypothetical protein
MKVIFLFCLSSIVWAALISQVVKRYRYSLLKRKSESWPVAQGAVQKSQANFGGPLFGSATKVPKSLFGYSYTVAGVRYFGFFAVARQINDLSDADLQRRLDGKTVRVRYNPQDHRQSFIVDSEIDGKQIHQNPDWIPRSLVQEVNAKVSSNIGSP